MNNSNSVPRKIANPLQFVMPHRDTPINSEALFSHGDVVFIQHQDMQYCLRRTRNGKLILTK
ncbi:MAG: hemin uptake protein HemP [Pseudomonadota bacterium]